MSRVVRLALLAACLAVALDQPARGEPPVQTDAHGDPLPDLARARLGTLRFRHGAPVAEVRFAPDGQTLLSISENGVARVWETATGKERYHFTLPSDSECEWLLTPDHRLLVTWTYDGHSLRLWETATGKLLRELTSAEHQLGPARLAPDGKTLVAVAAKQGGDEAIVRAWDLVTGKELRDFVTAPPGEKEDHFRPFDLHFLEDGKTLAALGRQGDDRAVRLWDFAGGKELPSLDKFPGRALHLTLAPDGKTGAYWLTDEEKNDQLCLVNLATGKKACDLAPPFPKQALPLGFSPDGRTLLAVDWREKNLYLWDVASGKALPAPVLSNNGWIRQVVFSPDSCKVAVGNSDGRLLLCEVASGKRLHDLEGYPADHGRRIGGLPDLTIAFSADGRLLAAAGSDNVVRLWDAASGKEIRPIAAGHEGVVRALAITADGKTAVSAGSDGTVRLWELATGREARVLTLEQWKASPAWLGPACLALSPDGKAVAVGSRSGMVSLWEVAAGKHRLEFKTQEGDIVSLAFTPDGTKLIAGALAEVSCWEATTGKRLHAFTAPNAPDSDDRVGETHSEQMVAMSPDGRLLAGADHLFGKVRLWELATGKLRRRLPASDRPMFEHQPESDHGASRFRSGDYLSGGPFVAFAPDGKTLASCWKTGIQLWDVVQGKELRRFGGQDDTLTSLAFAPAHGFLAAASDDGTVRFWDPATGTVLGELKAPRGGFHSLAFSPDGKTLFTGGSDTTILLWDVPRIMESWRPRIRKPSADELQELWKRLASSKGTEAEAAIGRLLAAPAEAVALLRERLRPAAPVEARRVERLLANLGSDDFEVRKRATEELEKLEEQAEPFLRKRLEDKPPAEVRKRVEGLLDRLAGPFVLPEQVQARRAVEVLERLGTAEAQAVLRELAKGAAGAHLTQDAKASLERLARRPASAP